MRKKCFSCHHGANTTVLSSLELHKRIHENTGQVFWVFKKDADSKTQIADDTSFKKILPQIKDNVGANWHHIAEFGHAVNDNVSKDTPNKKPKSVKNKLDNAIRKPKATRKPLEGNL